MAYGGGLEGSNKKLKPKRLLIRLVESTDLEDKRMNRRSIRRRRRKLSSRLRRLKQWIGALL